MHCPGRPGRRARAGPAGFTTRRSRTMFLTPRMSWWPHKRRAAGRPTACKPRLEVLEGRVMLTADVVVQWNTFTIDAVRADSSSTAPLQPGPTRVSRAFATVQAGIYDAVNSFQRLYTPYIAYVFVPPRAQDAA